MKRIIILMLAAFAVTSCAIQTTQKTTYRESSARILEPGLSAIITPLIADMEVLSQDKIAPYVEDFPVEVTTYSVTYVDYMKRTALLNAAKKYNADVIVAAIIDVETTPQGTYRITVTGYPARYVNFRNMTAEDTWMNDMTRPADNAAALRSADKQHIRIEK